jgi:glyoxylase-like metal-dependent hydrolase (beta-lactamase superfamily II)
MHGTRDRTGQADERAVAISIEADADRGEPHARRLRYPFDQPPTGAETFEVAPGILWARIPLPFRLNHVNVWLLREADGWTVIDTGTADDKAREVWQSLLSGVLSGAPVVRLVATHGHTDHVGLAGWLHDLTDAPYHISLVEWQSAQLRIEDAHRPLSPGALSFLSAHGCEPAAMEAFADDRRRTHTYMGPLPREFRRLRDGATITLGGRQWHLMLCGGHAAEQTSFWCPEDRILIAGDQILSKITPMIGVFPQEPEADPLTDYLASLDRFRHLPADTLVLPSHGLPFYGLHARLDELSGHHHQRLTHLEQLIGQPEIGMRLTHGLFPRAVAEGQGRHALAETLAHAHYLLSHGRARRIERDGQILFSAP